MSRRRRKIFLLLLAIVWLPPACFPICMPLSALDFLSPLLTVWFFAFLYWINIFAMPLEALGVPGFELEEFGAADVNPAGFALVALLWLVVALALSYPVDWVVGKFARRRHGDRSGHPTSG